MGQPLNVGGIITEAAARLQRQREAAREASEQIARDRQAQPVSEAPSTPEGQP